VQIRNYINILWRRKLPLLLTLITTMIFVVIGTIKSTPVYQASTTLRIATSSTGSVNYSDYMYADRLMNTYINIATSRPMTDELMKQLNLSQLPEITAEIVPNTELIKIKVEDTNSARAAQIANTLANILVEQSNKLYVGGGKNLTDVLEQQLTTIQKDLEKTRQEYENLLVQTPPAPEFIDSTRQLLQLEQNNYASLLGQYEQAKFREEIQASMITVFETAMVPKAPTKPRIFLNITLGLVVGLVGGLGLVFLFENLDTTLYEVEEIEATTKLPALVKIPKASKRELSTIEDNFSPLAESFRNLATNLELTNHKQPKKTLLILSAEPSQGKSMITYHLTCSLAELGNRVVAVDCDTRVPRLHNYFGLSNHMGLKDVLEQGISLNDALQKSSYDGVTILASGSQLAHPSHMLGSAQMAKLIKELKLQFDYVLLDSPAMLAVADVSALIPIADGLIMVVRQAHAQRKAVQAAGEYLAKQDGKFKLLIVNQVDSTSHYYYYKDRKRSRPFMNWTREIAKKADRISY
jgi:capsular exopolysaccharide synthesis family protein